MEKKINNYLHLYIGKKCIKKNSTVTNKIPVTITFRLIEWSRMSKCRTLVPILKDLKEMTKEEISEASKLCSLTRMMSGESFNFIQTDSEHILYLINKGYDVFGLIDSGLALKAGRGYFKKSNSKDAG